MIPYLRRLIAVAILSSIATMAFAEDAAPVYDADTYPPQFDGQTDLGPGPSDPQAAPAYEPSRSLTLEQRISRSEQQISSLQKTESAAKVESLQNEIQSLRGQVESLSHQLQQMQNQQKAFYADVDKRLSKPLAINTTEVETTQPPKSVPDEAIQTKTPELKPAVKPIAEVKPAAKKPVVAQPNSIEEQQIYQTAYNLIKAKKYKDAVAALQKMLQKYPTGQFAANAHYWLGELYGLMGNSAQSAVEFSSIVNNYPDSPKISDAQLKLGLIYAAGFKWTDAKSAFKKVINHFPGTASARLAAEQLKQIKEAGH